MYPPAVARDSIFILTIFSAIVALITSANLVADAIDKFDNYWGSQYALFVMGIVGTIFLPVPATFLRFDQARNKAIWWEIIFLAFFLAGFGGVSIYAAVEWPGTSYCLNTASYCAIYRTALAFGWIVSGLLLGLIAIDGVFGFRPDRRAVLVAEQEKEKRKNGENVKAEELVPGLLKKQERSERIEELSPVVV